MTIAATSPLQRTPPMTSLARSSRLAAAGAAALVLAACTDLPTAATPSLRAGSLTSVPRASHDAIRNLDFVEGQVIVRYREGVDADVTASRHRGRRKKELLVERTDLLEVAPGDEAAVVASLQSDSDVEFAELDYLTVISPCEVGQCLNANDGFNAPYKWDLHNTGTISNNAGGLQATGKADADIDWVEAFDALGGDAFTGTATVGIIDTGIRGTHNEFANGRVVAAQNFATGYPATLIDDRDGHGTHVAGIAAGLSNGVGTTGVAYGRNIRLISAKACELYLSNGVVVTSCPTSSQANAVVWAVDQGANVLNLSIGGDPRATTGSALVRAAFQYALSKNVLPVCAAGNDNYPDVAFPGRFPECLVVGATNWGDTRASYSNYGARLDVVAPGGDANALGTPTSYILSAGISSNTIYNWKAGTSMAAPQVTGLAALLYATGMTSAEAVRQRIKETTDDLGAPGFDTQYGNGRINAYRALTLKDPSAPPVVVIAPVADGVEGSPVAFDGSASFDPNNHPITFAWTFGDGFAAQVATTSHTFADNGSYPVTLVVTDQSNRATSLVRTVTVANANPVANVAIAPSVISGGSVPVSASFSDAGVLDAPWRWSIDWGNGRTSEVANAVGAIEASRRFCGMGTLPVQLTVTDKDGGSGSASTAIVVLPNDMRVSMPGQFNPKSNGSFPVRIKGTATLDVRSIDVGSVTVGDASVVVKNNGTFQAAYDQSGDGYTDLVVHVPREALAAAGAMSAAMTQLEVRATLNDGCTLYVGRQVVQVH